MSGQSAVERVREFFESSLVEIEKGHFIDSNDLIAASVSFEEVALEAGLREISKAFHDLVVKECNLYLYHNASLREQLAKAATGESK
jgi:hypothetical protein